METCEVFCCVSMAGMTFTLYLKAETYSLRIVDTVTDEPPTVFDVTPQEAGAIVFLALAGDAGEDGLITALYALAEPKVQHLPIRLRPIP